MLFQDIFTNGISYLNLMFDICRVPVELLPYVGVLKYVLGMVDTKNYSYGDFFNEVNMNTGGIGVSFNTYTDVNMRGKYSAFMEVKGVTLEEDGICRFPDAPTERGIKHINELVSCLSDGYEAYILFVIQMKGIRYFEPNYKTHMEFGVALKEAKDNGVNVMAIDCGVTKEEVVAGDFVEIKL